MPGIEMGGGIVWELGRASDVMREPRHKQRPKKGWGEREMLLEGLPVANC